MKKREIILLFIGCILLFIGLYYACKPYLQEGMIDTGSVVMTGLTTTGAIYYADIGLPSSPNWKILSGTLQQISGNIGKMIGINTTSGSVFYSADQIVLDSKGVLKDASWIQLSGRALNLKQVSLDWPAVYAIDAVNKIIYVGNIDSNPATAEWSILPGFPASGATFKYISAKGGRACAIGTDDNVYYINNLMQYSAKNVMGTIPPGTITQLSFDGKMVAAVDKSNKLYISTNIDAATPTWIIVNGNVKQISIQNGMAVCISSNNAAYFTPDVAQQDPGWLDMKSPANVTLQQVEIFRPINANTRSTRFPNISSCKSGFEIQNGICYPMCPAGFTGTAGTCVAVSTPMPTRQITPIVPPYDSCPTGYDLVNGSCIASCPSGYTSNGLTCSGPSNPKISYAPASSVITCPAMSTLIDGQCYRDCPAGSTINESNRIQCYTTVITKDLTGLMWNGGCPYGYTQYGWACHQQCPADYVDNGIYTCGKNPINRLTVPASSAITCPAGTNLIDGQCYEACPTGSTIYASNPTQCISQYGKKSEPAVLSNCPRGYRLSGTTCYQLCLPGDLDTGWVCETPPKARPTARPIPSVMPCNGTDTLTNNLCYQRCPANQTDVGINCKLPDITTRNTVPVNKNIPSGTACNSNETIQPEVYVVHGYSYTQATAAQKCASYGGGLATRAQLIAAQQAGAQWCSPGWVADPSTQPQFPTAAANMCNSGQAAGVLVFTPPGGLASATCYGPKPNYGVHSDVWAFNSRLWNQPNQVCYSPCPAGKTASGTNCITPNQPRPAGEYTLGLKCNKGEELVNDKCKSVCPDGTYPDGDICTPIKKIIAPPKTINCISVPFGTVKKWMCESQDDADNLVAGPSTNLAYASPDDQVCVTDDPTTAMYFCQSVADAISENNTSINIRKNYSATCGNLLKNYTDLSTSLTSFETIRTSIQDGNTQLGAATTALDSVYAQLKCSTAPANSQIQALCGHLQNGIKTIGADSTTVGGILTNLIPKITTILGAQSELQKSIKAMCPGNV
jgi:hypothetical protein